MSENRPGALIDDTAEVEAKLRALYTRLMAPPPPLSWSSEPTSPAPFRPVWSTRPWPRRSLGAVAVSLVGALIVALLVNRSSITPQPVLAVELQPAGASLDCKLPVSAVSNSSSTGFIVMRNGRATFEPVKTSGTTYVSALGVWADTFPQLVAPDGRSYVSDRFDYATKHEVITATDASGTRNVLDTKVPNILMPVSYTAGGDVLVTQPSINTELLLNPATGKLRPAPVTQPVSVGGRLITTAAVYDRNGHAPWSGFHEGGKSWIWRVDVATRQLTQWFDSSDAKGTAQVVATDSLGRPIVQVAESDVWHTDASHGAGTLIETILMTAPHQFTVLNHGRAGDPGVAGAFSPLSATSGTSIWLATDAGAIWLYRQGQGLKEIAQVRTSNQGAPGLAISGPCE